MVNATGETDDSDDVLDLFTVCTPLKEQKMEFLSKEK